MRRRSVAQSPPEPRPTSDVRRVTLPWTRALAVACAALVVGTLACLAAYDARTASDMRAEIGRLRTEVRDLSESHDLLVAEVASRAGGSALETSGGTSAAANERANTPALRAVSSPSGSGAKPTSALATDRELEQGIRVIVGRIEHVGPASPNGWPIRIRLGQYYDGDVAFSVAALHGDVLEGRSYVDHSSTKTIDARLLTNAKVHTGGGAQPMRTAALIAAIAAQPSRWTGTWFWLKLGPGSTIVGATEIPRG